MSLFGFRGQEVDQCAASWLLARIKIDEIKSRGVEPVVCGVISPRRPELYSVGKREF